MRIETSRLTGRFGRGFLVVLTVCSVCACGWSLGPLRPAGAPAAPADQKLFVRGMEEMEAARSSESLARLVREFPDSPWAARGRTVLGLREALRQEQQKIAELQKKSEVCALERTQLQSDVRSLEAYTARLKALLEEMGGSLPPR